MIARHARNQQRGEYGKVRDGLIQLGNNVGEQRKKVGGQQLLMVASAAMLRHRPRMVQFAVGGLAEAH